MKTLIVCLFFTGVMLFSSARDHYLQPFEKAIKLQCSLLFKPVGDGLFPDPWEFEANIKKETPFDYTYYTSDYKGMCRYIIFKGEAVHRASIVVFVSKNKKKAEDFMDLKNPPVLSFHHENETYYMGGKNLKMEFFVMTP